MPFVNICLRHTTIQQIVLAKIFFFLNPLYISEIKFKTVVLYGEKQTDGVLKYVKTDHTRVFETGNNSHIHSEEISSG